MNYRNLRVPLAPLSMLAASILLLGLAQVASAAQSQDEQYEFFLAGACTNMNFQRDGFFDLLPGQAGPQLTAFCNGPPPVGGGTISNGATGGGASTASGRSLDDVAQRRRRAAKHSDGDASKDADAVRNKVDNDDFSMSGDKASAFLSMRYQREKQKTTRLEGGRRSDLFGISIGSDYRFTDKAVAGIALKAERLSGDFDSGGDFQTNTTGVLLFGSWYPATNLFVDVTVGMDWMSLDTKRKVSFSRTVVSGGFSNTALVLQPTVVASKPDSRANEAELRGGYDFVFDSVTIGPRLGIKNRHTTLDAYSETGATPMTLSIDEQRMTSLQSTAGVQMSKAFTSASGVFVTQLNLDWLHEFKNDQRTITARFAEDFRADASQLKYQTEAPDRDIMVARVSVAAVFPHGFSSFVALDSLFGHAYLDRYGANVGVRKEF
jgi:uncharacterized protein YhjY with autotransporter beta-barrel domain